MATDSNRHEFPALRRRLILLEQEMYQVSQTLDINRRTPDASGDLMRYQLTLDALCREIDELTWALQYLDANLQFPRRWPLHYWLVFLLWASISVGLTVLLLLRLSQ